MCLCQHLLYAAKRKMAIFPDSEDDPEVQPGELLLTRNILETSNKNALFKTHKLHNQTLEYFVILLV